MKYWQWKLSKNNGYLKSFTPPQFKIQGGKINNTGSKEKKKKNLTIK